MNEHDKAREGNSPLARYLRLKDEVMGPPMGQDLFDLWDAAPVPARDAVAEASWAIWEIRRRILDGEADVEDARPLLEAARRALESLKASG